MINFNRFKWTSFLFLLLAPTFSAYSQTIAEKKSGATQDTQELPPEVQKQLREVNIDLKNAQEELRYLYGQVEQAFRAQAPDDTFQHLLDKIKETRQRIVILEENWREVAIRTGHVESYALWHQPETTIGQLIMDYGSQDYVYLFSPEIAAIKLNVDSNLIIPRASWEEMLDLILVQNGIGYKQLNPYLRELFLLKTDRSGLRLVTNQSRDLEMLPPQERISFVLTPEPAEVRRTWLFLDKFINPNSTVLQQIGRDILIIGQVAEVQDLLKLYDFIAANKGEKEFKIFPVTRVDAEEMAKILAAIFDQAEESSRALVEPKEGPRPPLPRGPGLPPPPISSQRGPASPEVNGLRIIPLSNVARALFLVGTKEEIRKAEKIMRQVEAQVGEARERIIFWYTTKHSEPDELADVLARIYKLMTKKGVVLDPKRLEPPIQIQPIPSPEQIADEITAKQIGLLPSELYQTSYYQQGNYVVNPAPIEPRRTRAPIVTQDRDNFIVDPKTSSIAMVIEADLLPKMKELVKKLDVPKRMVQIEALLFERRINKQNNFGLNLLKIGSCASQENFSCLSWNDPPGILSFILSRKKTCGLPAYDIAYRFLMTQDDIQINASPSVVAINQTPATIAIVEEISINTGIFSVETAKGNTLENAYTRAQYGITIDITPTIHIVRNDDSSPEDEPNYVTLETDLTFDTVQAGLAPDRPDVTRRHISNEVRVPDGQTVILGGLRRKITDDFRESIPFFGELPAIGKFFSQRELSDSETEMFIFLTPTIISHPLEDFEFIKCEEMRRRPGDIPEFLCCLYAAREREKNRVLANSMEIIFGPLPDRCYSPAYWRSGGGLPTMPPLWVGEDFPACGEYNGK